MHMNLESDYSALLAFLAAAASIDRGKHNPSSRRLAIAVGVQGHGLWRNDLDHDIQNRWVAEDVGSQHRARRTGRGGHLSRSLLR